MTSLALDFSAPRQPEPGEFLLEVSGRPSSKKNSLQIVRFGKDPDLARLAVLLVRARKASTLHEASGYLEDAESIAKKPLAKHGLIQGERYRDWEKRALEEIGQQWGKRPPITCQCRGTFIVRSEPAQRLDLYNAVAAMCDALQKAGVVVNDKLITSDGGSNIEVVRDGRPYIRAYLLPMQGAL